MTLGGGERHTRVPAELLDLPHRPADDFPVDPFVAPDARERSLRAAQERGDAWLDGAVSKSARGFTVALVLHAPRGRHGARKGRGDRRTTRFIGAQTTSTRRSHP